jgi:hypothetical protein
MGFQYRMEPEQFLTKLQDRMRKFGLALHSDKTRLLELGRFIPKVTLPMSYKISEFFENSCLHFVTTDVNSYEL